MLYAILFCEELATENEYSQCLDTLFFKAPENDDLLYLEWETDIQKAVAYIWTHVDYNHFRLERFGRILMSQRKRIYVKCGNIKYFARRTHSLWEKLPGNICDAEPFHALSYADDPLS